MSDCQRGSRKASQRSESLELNLERWLLTEQFCMGSRGSLVRETKPEFAGKSRSRVSFLLHFDLFLQILSLHIWFQLFLRHHIKWFGNE